METDDDVFSSTTYAEEPGENSLVVSGEDSHQIIHSGNESCSPNTGKINDTLKHYILFYLYYFFVFKPERSLFFLLFTTLVTAPQDI